MSTPDLFDDPAPQQETVSFEPTHAAGLARLEKFISRTGSHYAQQRNFDFGPLHRSSVSALSPWIRHRVITKQEVLTHTLARHSPSAAGKFIQEVFWRGYFKGWLEQHPSVWHGYLRRLATAQSDMNQTPSLQADYRAAVQGRTGIACFDHWSRELIETGYLHNHTRMWFASIWIFTLRLPWELGADFFLRNLMDGDPASNTLSWRWVGGLHTKGKTYLARPDNIARFTHGQFEPKGHLARVAEPLVEDVEHPLVPLPPVTPIPSGPKLLLITPEDCNPEEVITKDTAGVLGVCLPPQHEQNPLASAFAQGAVKGTAARMDAHLCDDANWATAVIDAAQKVGTTQVITPFAPLGPVAAQLNSVKTTLQDAAIHLHQQRRTYDQVVWPHATKGFLS